MAVRSSTLTWIAVPLAFVWVLPLGILIGVVDTILGVTCTVASLAIAIVVLLRSRHGIDYGRLPAWIAIGGAVLHVLVAVALQLMGMLIFHAIDPTGDFEPPEGVDEFVMPEEFMEGQCLKDADWPTIVSCDEPHRAEVVATFTVHKKHWFDDPEDEADEMCNEAVADFLGITVDESTTEYGMSISAEDPYAVACWAVADRSVTGTMRPGGG